jgi:hypothetical protein
METVKERSKFCAPFKNLTLFYKLKPLLLNQLEKVEDKNKGKIEMPNCSHCHSPLKNIAGVGLQPRYKCINSHCSTNKTRKLKCPNPSCNGGEMKEEKIGIGHQLYTCEQCHFCFDNLGQVKPVQCLTCKTIGNIRNTMSGGFSIRCSSCNQILEIEVV